MYLDPPTIHLLLTAICGAIAAAFMVAWSRDPSMRPYLWWSYACLMAMGGLVLIALRGQISEIASSRWGNGLVLAGAGLAWGGLRSLYGRSFSPGPIFAPAALWVLAGYLSPALVDDPWERVVWLSFGASALCLAIAWEIWRNPADRLSSSGPLAALVVLNGVFYGFRGGAALVTPVPEYLDYEGFWFGMSLVEATLFLVAATVFALSLLREQNERSLKDLAMRDPLTGALNRRGFYNAAKKLLRRIRTNEGLAAMLVVDLDSFKSINDEYGHSAGDVVLAEVAARIAAMMPDGALLCRLGGEEFALLYQVSSDAEPVFLAERLRTAASVGPIHYAGITIHATVSVGVAVLRGKEIELPRLLTLADQALYDAKEGGRNQVRRAAC